MKQFFYFLFVPCLIGSICIFTSCEQDDMEEDWGEKEVFSLAKRNLTRGNPEYTEYRREILPGSAIGRETFMFDNQMVEVNLSAYWGGGPAFFPVKYKLEGSVNPSSINGYNLNFVGNSGMVGSHNEVSYCVNAVPVDTLNNKKPHTAYSGMYSFDITIVDVPVNN